VNASNSKKKSGGVYQGRLANPSLPPPPAFPSKRNLVNWELAVAQKEAEGVRLLLEHYEVPERWRDAVEVKRLLLQVGRAHAPYFRTRIPKGYRWSGFRLAKLLNEYYIAMAGGIHTEKALNRAARKIGIDTDKVKRKTLQTKLSDARRMFRNHVCVEGRKLRDISESCDLSWSFFLTAEASDVSDSYGEWIPDPENDDAVLVSIRPEDFFPE